MSTVTDTSRGVNTVQANDAGTTNSPGQSSAHDVAIQQLIVLSEAELAYLGEDPASLPWLSSLDPDHVEGALLAAERSCWARGIVVSAEAANADDAQAQAAGEAHASEPEAFMVRDVDVLLTARHEARVGIDVQISDGWRSVVRRWHLVPEADRFIVEDCYPDGMRVLGMGEVAGLAHTLAAAMAPPDPQKNVAHTRLSFLAEDYPEGMTISPGDVREGTAAFDVLSSAATIAEASLLRRGGDEADGRELLGAVLSGPHGLWRFTPCGNGRRHLVPVDEGSIAAWLDEATAVLQAEVGQDAPGTASDTMAG